MATYVPNADDLTQPTEDKELVTAAAEFRTLKAKVESNQTRIDTLEGSTLQIFGADYVAEADIDLEGQQLKGASSVTTQQLVLGGVIIDPSDFDPDSDAQLRNDLATTGSGKGAEMVAFKQAGTGAVDRTASDKLREFVSVKDFGAVGDGVTDDYAAIQAAVNSGAKRILFPAGTYYSSQSIKLPHTGSYYRRDTGITIQGDGIYTILTRNNVTDVASSDENLWYQRSFFSVYGSNNIIENVQFYGCPIAIYFGQDPDQIGIELSHTSFNRVRNVLIQNCGTGILSACAQGHYYNHYESIHIAQSQIGVHFTTHSVWGSTVSNNNRNTFINVRASRCQVGFWLSNGDTNSVYAFHCEGCGTTPTNNSYSSPAGLPGGLTTAAFIITADNNDFFSCFHESCDFYVYHDALYTQSFGNLFRIDSDPAKQNFVKPLHNHLDRETAWIANGAFANIQNTNAAFPNTPAAQAVLKGAQGGYAVGVQYLSETATTSVFGQSGYSSEYVKNLGAVAALGTVSFTLWNEITSQTSSSALFEVSVVGNSQTNNLVHANTFKVIILRNSSRTPTRYYIYDQVVGRGTGANAGDANEPIVPTLSLGGTNVKDVIVTFTMPNRTFEGVSVVVKQLYAKT